MHQHRIKNAEIRKIGSPGQNTDCVMSISTNAHTGTFVDP